MRRMRFAGRIKYKFSIEIIRNGVCVKKIVRHRDLMVWKGQSVLANLLSQGAVGTETSTFYLIASSNSTSPNMNDDSGNPEENEFSPQIGTKVAVTYTFSPTDIPNSEYQTIAEIKLSGDINVTSSVTLCKIGIIDNIAVPNRNIIVEDAVVPQALYDGDIIRINYFQYLG